jgi:hypothetical protein
MDRPTVRKNSRGRLWGIFAAELAKYDQKKGVQDRLQLTLQVVDCMKLSIQSVGKA